MKYLITSALITLFILTSCQKEEKPKVIYPENEQIESVELKKDTTLIEISDLPIHIDSTKYIIHPIGEFQMYGSRGSKIYFGSSNSGSGSFKISSYNRYEISGNLNNLKFQHLESEELIGLTDRIIKINSITFLRDIFDKTQRQYLIYKVLDQDTNRDGKLDDDDIETLYLSNIDGKKFTKLTPEYQELIDWNIIQELNRIYFRSIEDTNKNGEFDKDDRLHYHYVDFSNQEWKLTEYYPL